MALKERGGSSILAIEKYIVAHRLIENFQHAHLLSALKGNTTNNKLVRLKNSWKLNGAEKANKTGAAKKPAPTPAPVAPKKVASKKGAPAKKAPKPVTPVPPASVPSAKKGAASPKKSALVRDSTLAATVRGPGTLRAKSRLSK